MDLHGSLEHCSPKCETRTHTLSLSNSCFQSVIVCVCSLWSVPRQVFFTGAIEYEKKQVRLFTRKEKWIANQNHYDLRGKEGRIIFEKRHTKTHQTQTGVAQSLCLSCCCWLLVAACPLSDRSSRKG